MNFVSEMAKSLARLFFPELCAGCSGELHPGEKLICLKCLHELPATGFEQYTDNPVEKIFWGRVALHSASAHFYFTKHSPLQHILHQLKYNGRKEIGYFLGRRMGSSLLSAARFDKIDALVPLPLFASRQKERGYNQAAILCSGMAEILKIPVLEHAVIRTRATETQTHKSRIGRWQNMEGKFSVQAPHDLAYKHLLLVDDVITTGATFEACAQELLKTPGTRVSIVALAYTVS